MIRASGQRSGGWRVAATGLALLVAGCSGGGSGSGGAESADYAIDLMSQRAEGDGVVAYDALPGALPSVSHWMADGVSGRASSSVVLGRFESAAEGRGFIEGGEPDDVTDVPFDDPSAGWRTIRARFRQTEVVAGDDLAVDGRLTLGFAVGSRVAAKRFGESLRALGDVLVFVRTDSPVFASEPGHLSVAEDGKLVTTVDESGDLALPFETTSRARALLAEVKTLEQLRVAAQRPATVVDVDALGRPVPAPRRQS